MSVLENFKLGNLVLPNALLFHYKDIFNSSDDFLIWQFIYLQNTTNISDLAPSQMAVSLGKTVAEVNQSISDLATQGLLEMKTVETENGIDEVIFDTSLALARLDELLAKSDESGEDSSSNLIKKLVEDFERELGRMISPFELEDLQKMIHEDNISPDLIRAALREAVFNGKTNWNYINAILRNWRSEGITTMRQVEERRKDHESSKVSKPSPSNEFLDAMDLWSD